MAGPLGSGGVRPQSTRVIPRTRAGPSHVILCYGSPTSTTQAGKASRRRTAPACPTVPKQPRHRKVPSNGVPSAQGWGASSGVDRAGRPGCRSGRRRTLVARARGLYALGT